MVLDDEEQERCEWAFFYMADRTQVFPTELTPKSNIILGGVAVSSTSNKTMKHQRLDVSRHIHFPCQLPGSEDSPCLAIKKASPRALFQPQGLVSSLVPIRLGTLSGEESCLAFRITGVIDNVE